VKNRKNGTRTIVGATLTAVCGAALCSACAGPFADDGTSASVGWPAGGGLRRPLRIPSKGDGYVIAPPWRERQSNYGTDELVGALVRATRAVAWTSPGSVAALGDLSRRAGGGSVEHKSHQSGRDVDIFYYATNSNGAPVAPGNAMIHYDRAGRAASWSPAQGRPAPPLPVPDLRFDVRRNWSLVRALLTDPEVEVQWIFAERNLAARLIQQGVSAGDDPALIAEAQVILRQPSDSEPHDDHMHVRIYCDPDDRGAGCIDRGPARWWKKHWKYMQPPFGRLPRTDAASMLLEILRRRDPLRGGRAKLAS
jgi:penicillin-insensitive murein endopeptidase